MCEFSNRLTSWKLGGFDGDWAPGFPRGFDSHIYGCDRAVPEQSPKPICFELGASRSADQHFRKTTISGWRLSPRKGRCTGALPRPLRSFHLLAQGMSHSNSTALDVLNDQGSRFRVRAADTLRRTCGSQVRVGSKRLDCCSKRSASYRRHFQQHFKERKLTHIQFLFEVGQLLFR
jgi:hypothetical protein